MDMNNSQKHVVLFSSPFFYGTYNTHIVVLKYLYAFFLTPPAPSLTSWQISVEEGWSTELKIMHETGNTYRKYVVSIHIFQWQCDWSSKNYKELQPPVAAFRRMQCKQSVLFRFSNSKRKFKFITVPFLAASWLRIWARTIYFSFKIISDKLYLFLYLTLPSDKLHISILKATETEHPVFSSYTQPCAFKKFHIKLSYSTELCHMLSFKPQYHLTAVKMK